MADTINQLINPSNKQTAFKDIHSYILLLYLKKKRVKKDIYNINSIQFNSMPLLSVSLALLFACALITYNTGSPSTLTLLSSRCESRDIGSHVKRAKGVRS